MGALSPLERTFINQFQGGFPVTGRPYSEVAARLGTDEATLILTIGRLLERGLLSRFGPLYDAERLGGALCLAAMAVPETDFERVASLVNGFPEVAHNYRRDHPLNMWFVLATETREGATATVERIRAATGLRVFAFPKEREFFLGLWLELDARGGSATRSPRVAPRESAYRPDGLDRRIVAATQEGLHLVPEPWEAVASRVGCEPSEVMKRMQRMLDAGIARRIGAVPNHYRLGLRGNGMTVWDVPDRRLAEVGERLAALDWVSHCYSRPRHVPQWRYNLFAMVHGPDRAAVARRVAEMQDMLLGEFESCDVLYSSAVLKKAGMRLTASAT
jgi:DNA-binding Lrp family transcriptional regulator